MARLEEKYLSSTFVLTAFISFRLSNIFPDLLISGRYQLACHYFLQVKIPGKGPDYRPFCNFLPVRSPYRPRAESSQGETALQCSFHLVPHFGLCDQTTEYKNIHTRTWLQPQVNLLKNVSTVCENGTYNFNPRPEWQKISNLRWYFKKSFQP